MPDFEHARVSVVWRGYASDVRVSGETMRQVRLTRGLSMEAVARATGLSYATIIRAERGRVAGDGKREAAMRLRNVEAIATALGVDPGLLIRRDGKVKGNGRNNADTGETVRDGGASCATGARGAHQADGHRVDAHAPPDPR